MAITTSYKDVLREFNHSKWKTINEFEEYYLLRKSETSSDWNYYTDKNGSERVIGPINHHPELKEYEVWIEGYSTNGESSTASLLGKTKARNFAQACHIIMCHRFLMMTKEENSPEYTPHCSPGRMDYDPSRLTHWGCNLYWSEYLAKKSFG